MVRDSSPAVKIEGPYSTNEELNSFTYELITPNSFQASSQTDTRRQSIFGRDDDDAILAPVSGKRSARIDGSTSFSAMDRYFDTRDLKSSVRTYIRRLESLVLPEQGLGWRVTDNVRNRVYDPTEDRGFLFTGISWQHSASEPNTLEWDIDFEKADGVQDGETPERYIRRRGMSDVGRDRVEVNDVVLEFAEVDTRRVERSLDISSNDLLHQLENDEEGSSPVLGIIESGIETEVTFNGTVYVPDEFESTINSFDRELHGDEAKLYDELSGTVWIGTITNSSSTVNAGEPANRFDFSVELEVGDVVTG